MDLTGAFLCAQKARGSWSTREPRAGSSTSPCPRAHPAASGGRLLPPRAGWACSPRSALELGEHGITVNAIAPGEIATPMTGAHDVELLGRGAPRCRSGGSARDRRTGRPRLAGCALRHRQLSSVDGGLMLTAAQSIARPYPASALGRPADLGDARPSRPTTRAGGPCGPRRPSGRLRISTLSIIASITPRPRLARSARRLQLAESLTLTTTSLPSRAAGCARASRRRRRAPSHWRSPRCRRG